LAGIRLIDLERCLIESEVTIPVGVAARLILDVARAAVSARRLMMDIGVLAPNRVVLSDSALIALFGEVLLTDIGVMSALLRCPRVAQLPGVSSELSPEESLTNATVPGSPEVYTLGVAFWQLLTNRWAQLPQGGVRAFKEPTAGQSIPPVGTVERVGLPVPEPVARVLRQATHRDARKRFTSLEMLVDALEQLPSNFVATSRQLQAFIQQVAPQVLPECEASATWSLPLRLSVPHPPPSRPITLHPNAEHDWEPPTFAERRLVAPVVPSGVPNEIARIDGSGAVVSIAPRKASRIRTLSWGFGAALVVAVATLALTHLIRHRKTAVVRVTVDSSISVQRPASPSTPVLSPSGASSSLNAAALTPQRQDQPTTATTPQNRGESAQNAAGVRKAERQTSTPTGPNNPYRPRKIAPYRPKGI
jgi:hypothetical protein